jgi:hypothetical protein
MTFLFRSDDESTLLNWLKSVEKSISTSGTKAKEYSFISLLLSSFLLTCSSSVAVNVLSTIASLCKADPAQVREIFVFTEMVWTTKNILRSFGTTSKIV